MVKSVMKVLLAASALVPGIAEAQQVDGRGDARVDTPRPEEREQHDQYRMQRPQRQQQRPSMQPGQPPQQGQPQHTPSQPNPYNNHYEVGRPDAPGGQGGYPGRGYPGGQRPNFGPNTPGGQGGYAGRGDPNAQRRDRGPNGVGGPNGYDQHGGPYRGQAGGYRGNPGYPPSAGPAYRGGWNNGWRGDHRYDWNSYRYENRDAFRLPRYYAPANWGYGYRRFAVGVTIGYGFYGEDYWIDDPYEFRLPAAYGPYRWVRYYNDALLVDIRSGYVVDAVYGIFW